MGAQRCSERNGRRSLNPQTALREANFCDIRLNVPLSNVGQTCSSPVPVAEFSALCHDGWLDKVEQEADKRVSARYLARRYGRQRSKAPIRIEAYGVAPATHRRLRRGAYRSVICAFRQRSCRSEFLAIVPRSGDDGHHATGLYQPDSNASGAAAIMAQDKCIGLPNWPLRWALSARSHFHPHLLACDGG